MIIFAAAFPVAAEIRLAETAKFKWERSEAWFGGWSGIEVTDAGQSLMLVNDKGRFLKASLRRQNGTLVGLTNVNSFPIRNAQGRRLKGKGADSEGLALASNGALYVSLERRHRVLKLNPDTGHTQALPSHPAANAMAPNGGFEALAITAAGEVLTLPEQSQKRRAPFDVTLLRDGAWRVIARISRSGPFLPVGADVDTQNRLWLLERAASPLGFRSRIRLFDLSQNRRKPETVLTSLPGRYDNLEGISVWQDVTGTRHLTLISDDNFLRIQNTQIVEFVVQE